MVAGFVRQTSSGETRGSFFRPCLKSESENIVNSNCTTTKRHVLLTVANIAVRCCFPFFLHQESYPQCSISILSALTSM
jgi:hypothetical protein